MSRAEDPMPRPLRAAMLAAALLTPFGSTTIAVALPGIGREMGSDPSRLNLWLVASYLLVSVVGQSPGGRLGDRIGHERALAAGILLHAIGAALGCAASGISGLAGARVLMAAGGAVTIPAVMALLRTRTPIHRRARAFGLLGGAMGLAAALGPPVGGSIVAWIGWRGVFLFNLPVTLLALLPVARRAWNASSRNRPDPVRLRPDYAGTALLVVGLAPLILAATPSSGAGPGMLIAGIAMLALFAVREMTAGDPVFDLRLFGIREFAAGSAIIALHNLVMYGLLFHLPAAAARAAGDGAGRPEPLLFGMLAGMVAGSPAGGRLAERAGSRWGALAGGALALAGLAIAPDPGSPEDSSRDLAGFVMLGLGLGLASAPAQASAMSSVSSRRAGSAAGALSTMRYLGGLAGIASIGILPAPGLIHEVFVALLGVALAASLPLPGRPWRSPRPETAAAGAAG